jgi:hypothetical protein
MKINTHISDETCNTTIKNELFLESKTDNLLSIPQREDRLCLQEIEILQSQNTAINNDTRRSV